MQKAPPHWPSTLVFIAVISGAGLFLLGSISFGVASLYLLITNGEDPAGAMIASVSAAFEGILLALIAWIVLQKVRAPAAPDRSFRLPFSYWHILAMLALGAIALPIGAWISLTGSKFLGWLILPALTLLLIIPPIWILLGLGTHKLDLGPRWRTLGIFGLGMTVGPLIMIGLELVVALILIFSAAVLVVQEPGMIGEITRLAEALQRESNPDVILQMVAPYIFNPSILAFVLGYIALAVPLIEEALKPLGVWLFARKIETPEQGFALGLLSGAAYALVESLGASGQGTSTWGVVVAVRAGTSLLHIFTAGFMGWAIVATFQDRKYWRLLVTYILAVLIHGIWNASALGAGFATTSDMLMNTNWSISILPAGLCGIMVLAIGMLMILVAINRRARKLSANESPAALAETVAPIPENNEGVK